MGDFPHFGIKKKYFVEIIGIINRGNPVIFTLNLRRLNKKRLPFRITSINNHIYYS